MIVQDAGAPTRGRGVKLCNANLGYQFNLMRAAARRPQPTLAEIRELIGRLESAMACHVMGVFDASDVEIARRDLLGAIEHYGSRRRVK